MNDTQKAICIAKDEGRPCHREPIMTRPVALCEPHRIEVALTVVPGMLRDQLAAAQRVATTPAPRMDLVATARAADLDMLLGGVHDSIVYFLANGGRVKIGYTTNLKSRLASLALRSDAVLLVLHGGPDLERALHAHFGGYRNGSTEWFELSPDIFRYIASSHPAASRATPRATPAADPSIVETDGLIRRARALMTDGQIPSVRALKNGLGVGQRRAQRIQSALRGAQA